MSRKKYIKVDGVMRDEIDIDLLVRALLSIAEQRLTAEDEAAPQHRDEASA